MVLSASQVEFVALSDSDKLALAEAALVAQFDDKDFNMESDIVLPVKGLQGVAVEWAFAPVEAIAGGNGLLLLKILQ